MFRLKFDYLQGFLFFKTPIYLVLVWMIARITGVAGIQTLKSLDILGWGSTLTLPDILGKVIPIL